MRKVSVMLLCVFVVLPAIIRAQSSAILREYSELLAIPNVASDTANIRKNAEFIASMMRKRGIEARLLELDGVPPAVFGELRSPGATRTLAVYAHYDGQPADPAAWKSGPWKPVVRDPQGNDVDLQAGQWNDEWRIYARSAADDKAPIQAIASALDVINTAGRKPSVNLKFFYEGEEEAGSIHLAQLLEKYRDLLTADAWLFCDGPVHQSGKMQLYFGVRGVTGLEMTVYGPLHAMHSGHYGNWVPNPVAVLVNLLATMRDADGKVLVPAFYESVRPLSESERQALKRAPDDDREIRQSLGLAATEGAGKTLLERITELPALNLRGISGGATGEKAANAIPTEARASIDFRLVPDQTPEQIRRVVEAHIRRQGFTIVDSTPDLQTRLKYPRIIRLQWESGGYPASRTSMDLPVSRAVVRSIEQAIGQPVVQLPTLGASAPFYLFETILKAPVIGLPIVNADNNQHAPDENLRLKNLRDGISIFSSLFTTLNW